MGWLRRVIPGNVRTVAVATTVPDAWGVQAASLGLVTNTYSPASAGRHGPRPGAAGFTGDPGFGVNRWSGAGSDQVVVQPLMGPAIAPVTDPESQRLGFGAGVSGQPGLPSTGDQTGALGWSIGLGG